MKQVVTLDDSGTTVLLTCWPERSGKATFDMELQGKMLLINNVKLVSSASSPSPILFDVARATSRENSVVACR